MKGRGTYIISICCVSDLFIRRVGMFLHVFKLNNAKAWDGSLADRSRLQCVS